MREREILESFDGGDDMNRGLVLQTLPTIKALVRRLMQSPQADGIKMTAECDLNAETVATAETLETYHLTITINLERPCPSLQN